MHAQTEKIKKPFYKGLFFQIIASIVAGILVGYFWPTIGVALKPLGDGFIKLIKMIIAPLVFGVVVVGIAKVGDIKAVGRMGGKTILYFEIVTTLALIIGMVVANLMNPGAGMNVNTDTLSTDAVTKATKGSQLPSTTDFFLNMIPESALGAFANNSILQVLLISCLCGFAIIHIGGRTSEVLVDFLEHANKVMFQIMGYIMKLTALATFGALAFAVSQYGINTLLSFGKLFIAMTVACLAFLIILAIIMRVYVGLSLWKLILYVREEILLAFATGSTEAVMPQLMNKFERAGCNRAVVGLVVPTGYSFNLGRGLNLFIAGTGFSRPSNRHRFEHCRTACASGSSAVNVQGDGWNTGLRICCTVSNCGGNRFHTDGRSRPDACARPIHGKLSDNSQYYRVCCRRLFRCALGGLA